MGKIKSAVVFALVTVLLLGLCFMSTVSFSYGTDQMHTFNSVVSMLSKDFRYGGTLADGENYLGGGYYAVYYPEGVISAQEYEDNLAAMTDEKEKSEYVEQYAPYPDTSSPELYLDREKVLNESKEVSEEFEENFRAAAEIVSSRAAGLREEGVRLDVRDDYTLRLFLPASMGGQSVVFTYFGYLGELTLTYGADESSAAGISFGEDETVADYLKGASSSTRNGTSYVKLDFTDAGKKVLSDWTADAAESAGNLYVKVGDNALISLPVSSALSESSLYISGNYTQDTARAVALVIDSSLKGGSDFSLTAGDAIRSEARFGNTALVMLYVSFGVLFAAMLVFFFLRYRMLGFVHLYTYLCWLFAMIFIVWGSSTIFGVAVHFGVETLLALLFGGAPLCFSNIVTFESAKKGFEAGRAFPSAVKDGYKANSLPLLDLHVVLALFSFITFAIALTELSLFAFVFGIAVVLSCLCSLALNRFFWACMMSFAKDKAKFCNFKRGEVAQDE